MVKHSSMTAGFLREHGIYANLVILSDNHNPLDLTVYLDAKPIFSGTRIGKTTWELEAFPFVTKILTRFARKHHARTLQELRRNLWSSLCKLSCRKVLKDLHIIEWESTYLQDLSKALLNCAPAIQKDLLNVLISAAQRQFGEEGIPSRHSSRKDKISQLCCYSTVEAWKTDCLIWTGSAQNRVPSRLMCSILMHDQEKSEELSAFSSSTPFLESLDCLMTRYGKLIDPMMFYTALAEKKLINPNLVRSAIAKRYLKALDLLMRHRAELWQEEQEKKVLVPRF